MAGGWKEFLSTTKTILSRLNTHYSLTIAPKRTVMSYPGCSSVLPRYLFRPNCLNGLNTFRILQGTMIFSPSKQVIKTRSQPLVTLPLFHHDGYFLNNVRTPKITQSRTFPTLHQILRGKRSTKKLKKKSAVAKNKILNGPQRKGVCVKVFIRKPKKPNSANRKCALLRLNNGQTIIAYIPGEKASLQEHAVVLFEGGRVQDCPGVRYKIVRGKYDVN